MRHAKSPVQGFDIKYPHLDSTVLNRRANDLKGLVNDALERSTFPFHVVEEFFALTHPHKITVLSDFENDILRLVSLSEFLGISSEKLKKKTAFSSISTDMKHMVSVFAATSWFHMIGILDARLFLLLHGSASARESWTLLNSQKLSLCKRCLRPLLRLTEGRPAALPLVARPGRLRKTAHCLFCNAVLRADCAHFVG
jgi:hypothetical protein